MTRKSNPRRSAARASGGFDDCFGPFGWRFGLVGWLAFTAGLVLYLLWFYRQPLPVVLADGGAPSRGAWIGGALLLVDQLAAGWFGDPVGFSILDRWPVVAWSAAIAAAAWTAGRLVLGRWLERHELTRLERFVFSVGVGLNLVSTYVLGVGLVGGLRRPALLFVPAGAVLVAAIATAARRGRGRRLGRRPDRRDGANSRDFSRSSAAGWHLLFGALAVPFAAAILLGAVLPPIEFDVREYHLQAPKEFFQQGRITFLPHNVYANMPLGSEMLALAGMVVTGDWWLGALVGKTLIALFAPFTALALYAAGRRFVSPISGAVAAIVYLSTPWVVRVSNLGLVEGAVGFYALLAVFAVLLEDGIAGDVGGDSIADDDVADDNVADDNVADDNVADDTKRSPGRWSTFALAGYLAGAAAACKYPALLFVVAPLAAWVTLGGTWRGSRRCDLRAGLVFLFAALLGCGLWLGKNAVLAGNPTYPLLYSVFGGETRTPEKNAQWRRAHEPPNFDAGDLAGRIADVAGRSPWQTPLVVPLALLALVSRRSRRLAMIVAAYLAFVFAAWWLFTHRIDRFWVPMLPLAALLAGIGAAAVGASRWRWLIGGLLAIGLAGNLLLAIGPAGYNRFFVSYDRLRTSPERVSATHLALNELTRPGLAVLSVGDAQVFDLEMPVFYSTVFDGCLLETWLEGRSPAEFHRLLVDRRVQVVYVDWGEISRYRSRGNYGFSDFVRPEVFERLVEAGVLERLPRPKDAPVDLFAVRPHDGND